MYYVYILKSERRKEFYVGFTQDLKKRIREHNEGKSLATKRYIPWDLVYYEAYSSLFLAKNREIKLKHHGKGLAELKKRILEG